jgi:hypothetical protein
MLIGQQTEPRSYEDHKRQILARFSEAQRKWENEAGARLVVSQTPPYFSYTRDLPAQSKSAA